MSAWFQQYGHDRVAEGLIVGAVPRDAEDVAVLRELGVRRVVSLVGDVEYEDGQHQAAAAAYAAAGIAESRAPSEDFGRLPAATLERSSGLAAEALGTGEVVYLHCRAGLQRSVITAAATLSRMSGEAPEGTLRRVRERRTRACPLPHQIEDLTGWWSSRGAEGPGSDGSATAGPPPA